MMRPVEGRVLRKRRFYFWWNLGRSVNVEPLQKTTTPSVRRYFAIKITRSGQAKVAVDRTEKNVVARNSGRKYLTDFPSAINTTFR